MFDDVEESGGDVTPESPDRAIAWAIWSREADVTSEEGWAIFHERYPDDPRFLLLGAYAELSETVKHADEAGALTASYLLSKIDRVLAGANEELVPRVRELLVYGGLVVADVKDEDAARLAALRSRVGAEPSEPKRDERERAGLRLRRFEREVLREIEERTQDNRPLATRTSSAPTPAPGDVWQSALAGAARARRPYAADAAFAMGDLVEHPRFGVGVVTGIEPGKAVIVFETGTKKLVAKT